MTEPLLLNIDDDDIEAPGYLDRIKARHFAKGVPVIYAASEEPDNENNVI